MTDLRSTLERYVNMRQGLGYKFQRQSQRLAEFVSFISPSSSRSWRSAKP
jgi:hypothetical protein